MRQIKNHKVLLSVVLLLYILCSCEFDADQEISTYKFLELAPLGIEIKNGEISEVFYPFIDLSINFYSELIKSGEITIDKIVSIYSDIETGLNEHLLEITNEHNIYEWTIISINDGFEFVGTSFE